MKRFLPSFVDHMARYVFALERVKDKDVLDLGCNNGFGSQVLSFGAKSIIGIDIREKNLAATKEFLYYCPTNFKRVDLETEFLEDKFDAVVAFEILEHLSNPEEVLKKVFDSLHDRGILIFSVPHMVKNHEHKVLFDEQKIKDLVSKFGTIKEFYIQDSKSISKLPLYKGLRCYVGVVEKYG